MECDCVAAGPEFTASDAASRASASDICTFLPGEQDLLLAVVVQLLDGEERDSVLLENDRTNRLLLFLLHSVHVCATGFEPVDPPEIPVPSGRLPPLLGELQQAPLGRSGTCTARPNSPAQIPLSGVLHGIVRFIFHSNRRAHDRIRTGASARWNHQWGDVLDRYTTWALGDLPIAEQRTPWPGCHRGCLPDGILSGTSPRHRLSTAESGGNADL